MPTVLIVDDDALVREGLRLILGSTPDLKVVGEAQDGLEAITETQRLNPDVVLMDLRMARLDGKGATERIVLLPQPPKILVLTTFDSDEHVIATLNAGASGYLLKDTPPREIIQAVRETAEGRSALSPKHTRVLLDEYAKDYVGQRAWRASEMLSELTEREREVVAGVAAGLTNPEIGTALHCSAATVKAHLASIFTRLGVANRIELAILGHDAGLSMDAREGSG